ncbi:hypothetical protein [Streptomyces sp. NPDC014623]|uniref:hypothetical protein n=1 Tax=Streptomyces sp. NPDC014623 TaxID=3364875 RepID=UPI0036FFEE00
MGLVPRAETGQHRLQGLAADGRRAAFWIRVILRVIAVPLVARFMPESLICLVAEGRTAEAHELAGRYAGFRPPDTGQRERREAQVPGCPWSL